MLQWLMYQGMTKAIIQAPRALTYTMTTCAAYILVHTTCSACILVHYTCNAGVLAHVVKNPTVHAPHVPFYIQVVHAPHASILN